MDSFLSNISSFPTAIYTTALVVVVGYWLLAIFGNLDFEAFDVGVDVDLDIEADSSSIGSVAGLLSTLGLTGVPITVVISLLCLNAWFICYFASLLIPEFSQFISLIQLLINLGIAIVSFMASILVTAIMIKPLKGIFKKLNQQPIEKSLMGISCRVRSSRVDNDFGEAECQHEGASLIIKVRSLGKQTFIIGDTIVPIEHNNENGSFTVISEAEFKQQLNQ